MIDILSINIKEVYVRATCYQIKVHFSSNNGIIQIADSAGRPGHCLSLLYALFPAGIRKE